MFRITAAGTRHFHRSFEAALQRRCTTVPEEVVERGLPVAPFRLAENAKYARCADLLTQE
jgi:hypothetical protein